MSTGQVYVRPGKVVNLTSTLTKAMKKNGWKNLATYCENYMSSTNQPTTKFGAKVREFFYRRIKKEAILAEENLNKALCSFFIATGPEIILASKYGSETLRLEVANINDTLTKKPTLKKAAQESLKETFEKALELRIKLEQLLSNITSKQENLEEARHISNFNKLFKLSAGVSAIGLLGFGAFLSYPNPILGVVALITTITGLVFAIIFNTPRQSHTKGFSINVVQPALKKTNEPRINTSFGGDLT